MSAAKTQSDIAVLQTELTHVKELVERNHRDSATGMAETKASLTKMADSLEALKVDMNERKGAEKLATAIRMTLSGAIGASIVKAAAWVGSVPIK